MIWAQIGTDSAFPMIVYDGSAFTPLWSDHSTLTDNGNGQFSVSLLPLGGWWRDDITITAGDFFTAEEV